MPHIMGVCFGLILMISLIGAGLGALFEAYPVIHSLIKIIGIGYLLYLARCIAIAGGPRVESQHRKPFTFLQAAAFQWVNPKAWVVFIGAIAAFTTQGSGLLLQIVFIIFVMLIAGFTSLNIWLWFGASMANVIRTEKHRRLFNYSMALLLVLSILPMALSELD